MVSRVNPYTGEIENDDLSLSYLYTDQQINNSIQKVGIANEIVFTAVDYNTVDWEAGNIALGNGDTYTVVSGTTGNMTATTYIYLVLSTSSLNITTTASESVGTDKILICVAKPTVSGKKAEFSAIGTSQQSVFISAGNIASGTITANEIASNYIYTNELSANQISTGTLSADRIATDSIDASKISFGYAGSDSEGGVINNGFTSNDLSSVSSPSTGVKIDSTGIKMYSGGTEKIKIGADGNATFQGTITASTINGTTITGGTIKTSDNNGRIQIDSTGFTSYGSTGNERIKIPANDDKIKFRNSDNSDAGYLFGSSGSLGPTIIASGVFGASNIVSTGDIYSYKYYIGTSDYIDKSSSSPRWNGNYIPYATSGYVSNSGLYVATSSGGTVDYPLGCYTVNIGGASKKWMTE